MLRLRPRSRAAYEAAGAKIVRTSEAFGADLVCKVRATSESELKLMRAKSTLIRCARALRGAAWIRADADAIAASFVYPAQNEALMKMFSERQLTVLALDAVPRTLSRSQAFDALSSQGACAVATVVFASAP